MMRLFAAVAAALALGGTAAGTVAAQHETRLALGAPVPRDTPGVSVDDGLAGAAVVHAPAGTSLLAVVDGVPAVTGNGDIVLDGLDADAGAEVTYIAGPQAVALSTGPVRRGDVVGKVPPSGAVAIRATLDSHPLDVAPLLRASLGIDPRADWHKPVDGAVVSQPFGCTPYAMEPRDPHCPSGHIHTGIDLAVPLGTPVYAALGGTVQVIVSATGYGLHVVVDSGDGLTTLYGHLSAVTVHDGDDVDTGEVIGAAGSTGNSTGPHLHFEVRRDGIPEDPTLDMDLP